MASRIAWLGIVALALLAGRPAAAQAPSNRIYLPLAAVDAPVGDLRAQSGDRVAQSPGDCWEPHLAPSGDLLVYLARPSADEVEIRLVDVVRGAGEGEPAFAGRGDREVDLGPRFEDLDLPTFAPDGRNLLFAGLADGQWDVYRLPIAGGIPADPVRIENLTGTPDLDEGRPALSPDGRMLAFDFHRGADHDDIAVLDLVSGRRTRLTDHPAVDRLPTFSPDGKALYFRSERTGRSQIHRVAVGGGEIERVSFYPANDGYATVAPDARAVLFESDRGGRNGIYVMDSTGRNRRALLADWRARYATPRYGPDGRTVAFSAALGDEPLAIHLMRLPDRDAGQPAGSSHGIGDPRRRSEGSAGQPSRQSSGERREGDGRASSAGGSDRIR